MTIEELLEQERDLLGATWLGPISLAALLAEDAVRVCGTDNGLVVEFRWSDAAGAHVECWTLPEASQLDKFH